MNDCLAWKRDHPVAAYVGSASQGLGFYHLEVPDVESTQWLNLTNCGVVRVRSGEITLAELENELSVIYCKDWPWQIRELEKGNFLVRFPPHKRVADIKNYPSFNLRKAGVQVEVLEWIGDMEPYGELQEVWVQMKGIPPRWCHWRVFAQIASGFGLLIAMDWPTLFKSFYETVRIKVACKDYKKIPEHRLFEMNKKLHVVSFFVEVDHGNGQDNQDNDGDDGGDNGKNDDEADDLYDTDNEDQAKIQDKTTEGTSGVKTPAAKTTLKGCKTVKLNDAMEDPLEQEECLKKLMADTMSQLLIASTSLDMGMNSGRIDVFPGLGSKTDMLEPIKEYDNLENGTSLRGKEKIQSSETDQIMADSCPATQLGKGFLMGVVTPVINMGLEQSGGVTETASKVVCSSSNCNNEALWETPNPVREELLDCNIVGNKLQSLLDDSSQHLKWEDFRKIALQGSETVECSTLLQRMELADSEEEDEVMIEDEYLSMEEARIIQDKESQAAAVDDKKTKRKNKWGPDLRISRPRRHPEDGKTVAQRAQEIRAAKDYGQGTKMLPSNASKSSSLLLEKINCVHISLGVDKDMINDNLETITNRDLNDKARFMEANPEINLPADLDIDVNINDYPPLSGAVEVSPNSSLKKIEGPIQNSWVKIVNKGLKPSNESMISNDRSHVEC